MANHRATPTTLECRHKAHDTHYTDSAGFRLGEALSYIKLGGPLLKTGGPLRLGFEAFADCEALSCSLFSLCLNPALYTEYSFLQM